MQALLTDALLTLARRYAAGHRLTLGTVGRKIAGDHRFFSALRDGTASFTAPKFDACVRAFAENWPASQDWPRDLPMPGDPVAVVTHAASPFFFAASERPTT